MSVTIRYSATINGIRHSVDIPAARFGESDWCIRWAIDRGYQDNAPDESDVEAIEMTWANDWNLSQQFWGDAPVADKEAWHREEDHDIVVERVEPWPELPNTLHLSIRTANAAFDDGIGWEVARILRALADRVEGFSTLGWLNGLALFDINGNLVGATSLEVTNPPE